MNTIWFRRSLLPVMMAMLAFTPFASALASPPEFSTATLDATIPIAGCEFPAESRLLGTFKVSTHFDQDGEFKMTIERVVDSQATYTNLATGKSLSSTKGAGIDKFQVQEDGTFTYLVMGLIDIVQVPGKQLVVQDVGRLVFDASAGELIFSAGQFTVHGPGGSVEALCAALE